MWAAFPGLAGLAATLLLVRLRQRAAVVTVDGDSMWPASPPAIACWSAARERIASILAR